MGFVKNWFGALFEFDVRIFAQITGREDARGNVQIFSFTADGRACAYDLVLILKTVKISVDALVMSEGRRTRR